MGCNMQVINMHLASESEWDEDKHVYYLAVEGDCFTHAQQVELKILKQLSTIPFYVFEQPPTDEAGFLGVDEANNTLIFATKNPTINNCYKYFVTGLETLKQKCNYNPFAEIHAFVKHFKHCPSTTSDWRKPFVMLGHANWLVDAPLVSPPPHKPKFKWTLTNNGVAYS